MACDTWASEPISIVGVEVIDMTPEDGHRWWMVGNDYVPDAMVFLGAGQNDARVFYPPPYVWPFPAKESAKPEVYIDLHGLCAKGKQATVMVTYFYIDGGGQ